MTIFSTIKEYEEFIKKSAAVIAYFSTSTCNVCKVLKPKVEDFVSENFSKIKTIYIDIEKFPEFSAQKAIFTIPTIILFFEGKEYIRKSRNLNFEDFFVEIERLYSMFFDN